MAVRLSICVPVYNCAEFLPAALDSILSQATRDVEIIVYDGGSTDTTPAVMESYRRRSEAVRYERGRERGGIDADLATCAGHAGGEYLWLFSGDDVMRPGALARVLEWTAKGADVLIGKHTNCSRDMAYVSDHPVFSPDEVRWAELSDASSRRSWFQHAVTSEAFFSFISGLVVRRRKWEEGTMPEEFRRSCWGHVARLFSLIPSGLRVCYVPELWVDKRGENDSFADRGVVNRVRITVDGYHGIARHFFGQDSLEAFHIRKVIRKEVGLRSFLEARRLCREHPEVESKATLDRLVRETYRDRSLRCDLTRFAYAWPAWIIDSIRFVYRLGNLRRIERWLRKSNQAIMPR